MRNYLTNSRANGFNLFDDFFDSFFQPVVYTGKKGYMSTDVKETDKEIEFSVDLPGFDKKDISLTLSDGYLRVEANREDKQEDGNRYIRRERNFSCSRTFYVGDAITEEDVNAKYDNGTLVLVVPKKEKEIKKCKNIEIK